MVLLAVDSPLELVLILALILLVLKRCLVVYLVEIVARVVVEVTLALPSLVVGLGEVVVHVWHVTVLAGVAIVVAVVLAIVVVSAATGFIVLVSIATLATLSIHGTADIALIHLVEVAAAHVTVTITA